MAFRNAATAVASIVATAMLPDRAYAARATAISEIVPNERDRTHAVWMNGPTHTGKIGGNWPSFTDAAGSTDSQCTTALGTDAFSGYRSNGRYCWSVGTEIDDEPYLLLASGNLGLVMNAGGLSADVRSCA